MGVALVAFVAGVLVGVALVVGAAESVAVGPGVVDGLGAVLDEVGAVLGSAPAEDATATPAANIIAAPDTYRDAFRSRISPLSTAQDRPLRDGSAGVAQPRTVLLHRFGCPPHPGEQLDRARNGVVDERAKPGDVHRPGAVVDADPDAARIT